MKQIKSENDVKALVKHWLNVRAAWHYAPIQTGMGAHGIADRVGVIPVTVTPGMVGKKIGLFIAIEAKKPGRRNEEHRGLSKHQYLNMTGILDAGGLSIVCDGQDDLDKLGAALECLNERT